MTNSQSLTKKTGRSALSQLMGGGLLTVIRLGASFFLARALTPTDFGIIGMAIIVREFIFVTGSLGMGAGIIVKKEVSEEDLCTFFWSMFTVRCLMFCIGFFGAPLSIYIFDDPRVVDVLRAISFTFLMSSIAVAAYPILAKKLEYFKMNLIGIITALLESVMAVLLVYNTSLGYWALVYAMLAQAFVSHMCMLLLSGWLPKFKFNKDSFNYLFRYGINGLGFSITNYLRQNLDYLLVGRLLGTTSLGLYEFAYRIPHLIIDRVAKPVGVVILPALSKVKNDNSQLALGYIKVIKFVGLIAFPLLFGLMAVSDIAVPVLWGDQWLSIVTPLRLLCLCAILRVAVQPLGAIFNRIDRPDLPFKISTITLVWTVIVVWLLGHLYGLNGVAIGMVLSTLPGYISTWIAFRMINAKVSQLSFAVWPVFMSAILCGLTAFITSFFLKNTEMALFIVLGLSIMSGAIAYILSCIFLFPKFFQEFIIAFEEIVGWKFLSGLKKESESGFGS